MEFLGFNTKDGVHYLGFKHPDGREMSVPVRADDLFPLAISALQLLNQTSPTSGERIAAAAERWEVGATHDHQVLFSFHLADGALLSVTLQPGAARWMRDALTAQLGDGATETPPDRKN